jgi:hypothetical protein
MGCLLAPVRAFGCLVLLAALVGGWLYRDRIMTLVGRATRPTEAVEGRPTTRALTTARAKIDSLARGRADSVVLDAAQAASLISAGLDPTIRGQIDSLSVRLLDGEVEIGGQLSTARLPRELLGPLTVALRSREPVRAAGPIRVTGPARGEWTIQRMDVRGVPVPRDAVQELLTRALNRPNARTVPVRLPIGVRAMRIRPTGAVLIGAPTS